MPGVPFADSARLSVNRRILRTTASCLPRCRRLVHAGPVPTGLRTQVGDDWAPVRCCTRHISTETCAFDNWMLPNEPYTRVVGVVCYRRRRTSLLTSGPVGSSRRCSFLLCFSILLADGASCRFRSRRRGVALLVVILAVVAGTIGLRLHIAWLGSIRSCSSSVSVSVGFYRALFPVSLEFGACSGGLFFLWATHMFSVLRWSQRCVSPDISSSAVGKT